MRDVEQKKLAGHFTPSTPILCQQNTSNTSKTPRNTFQTLPKRIHHVKHRLLLKIRWHMEISRGSHTCQGGKHEYFLRNTTDLQFVACTGCPKSKFWSFLMLNLRSLMYISHNYISCWRICVPTDHHRSRSAGRRKYELTRNFWRG